MNSRRKKIGAAFIGVATSSFLLILSFRLDPPALADGTSNQNRNPSPHVSSDFIESDKLNSIDKNSGKPLNTDSGENNSQSTDDALNVVISKYRSFLKENELQRVSNVKSYEDPNLTSSYTYEIWINSPSVTDLRKWKSYKDIQLSSLAPELRTKAEDTLGKIEENYLIDNASKRRVTVEVPHGENKPILFSEFSILDLRSGPDLKLASAHGLPEGRVYQLLQRGNVRANLDSSWRYDMIVRSRSKRSDTAANDE